MHPPTSVCFARHFLQLIPAELSNTFKHDLMELTRFLSELAVIDYFFVPRKMSSLGLGALLHAMDIMHLTNFIPNLFEQLKHLRGFNPFSDEVNDCRIRLRDLYLQGGYSCGNATMQAEDTREETISPVCVSAFKSGTTAYK